MFFLPDVQAVKVGGEAPLFVDFTIKGMFVAIQFDRQMLCLFPGVTGMIRKPDGKSREKTEYAARAHYAAS